MLSLLPAQRHAAIDVGAHAGLYSLRMSKLFARVYAFEPNEDLTADLINYNPGNIVVSHIGLSSEPGEATLFIPLLGDLPLTGWASLSAGSCPATEDHLTRPVKLQTLDSLNLDRISFIKIDVEGHELEVLQGASRALTEFRPTVLVEIKQRNLKRVLGFFEEIDYAHHTLDELLNVAGSPENHVFLPRRSFSADLA